MELSPSWEAANCAPTQELPSILWNPKVHYRVHKRPALVHILSQIDSADTTPSHLSLRSILIHILYSTRIHLLSHSCYMSSPSHPPWLDHSNYIWRRVQVMKLLIMMFSPIFHHFNSLLSTYSTQHPVLKHPSPLMSETKAFHLTGSNCCDNYNKMTRWVNNS
jgi:hypothetical protein